VEPNEEPEELSHDCESPNPVQERDSDVRIVWLALKSLNTGKDEVKVKVKFTLEQATKAQRWSRGIAVLFLEPRCWMGVGGKRHASAPLPLGETWYPLSIRLDGPQGRSGRVRKISYRDSIPGPSSP
jgi:hypothetical protein